MNRGAAERAVGVGPEPRVDAGDVERVATLGQRATAVAVLELRQADGAVQRRRGCRGVDEDGDGLED